MSMFKDVIVSKVRKKRVERKVVNVPEPIRRSLYDVLLDNLKIAGRVTFIHRLLYIGEHNFPQEGGTVNHFYKNAVAQVNSFYCEEYLSGFILYYPRYFAVVIEGSEETLNRHLKVILKSNESYRFGRMKLLCAYHHAKQRMLPAWFEDTNKPSNLLEKLDPNTDLHETVQRALTCVKKLYKIGLNLRKEAERAELHSALDTQRKLLGIGQSTTSRLDMLGRISELYPEYQLLEFLLQSQHSQDLREYEKAYGNIPYLYNYAADVHPVICDFVPKNMFESEFDPITDMPEKEEPEGAADFI